MTFKKLSTALLMFIFMMNLSAASAAVSVGQKAPALVATDLADVKVDLDRMKDKIVIVMLWTSGCKPCRSQILTLRDFYHKYEDKGVKVIALSLDQPLHKKSVQKVAAVVDYHVVLASEATENGFEATEAVPETYVVNREGNISAVFSQKPVTEEELLAAVFPQH